MPSAAGGANRTSGGIVRYSGVQAGPVCTTANSIQKPSVAAFATIVNSANTTVTDYGFGTYTVVKTGGTDFSWDSLAVSTAPITGSIRLRISPTQGWSKFGISTAPGTAEFSPNYSFQFAPGSGGGTYYSESPSTTVPIGGANWNTGETFWLDYDRALGEVKYYKGADFSTATLLRTVSGVLPGSYYFDGQAYNTGGGAEVLFWQTAPAITAYSLAADVGSYSLTGTAATPRIARQLAGAVGSYTLTGTAAVPRVARRIVGAVGSYSLTGTATGLRATRKLVEAVGSYAITGTATALRIARKLTEAVGSYTITGTATALRTARRLTATPGSYSLTGVSSGLAFGRRISAAPGSYGLTGAAVTLTYTPASGGLSLTATPGAYALTGGSAALRIARKLRAATGRYTLNGSPVVLVYTSIWVPSADPATDYTVDQPEAGTWAVVPPPVPAFVNTEQATATWTEQTPGTWQ